MLEHLGELDSTVLQRLLRRTTVLTIIVGSVGVGLALLFGAPLAAVGIVLGLVLAIFNLRFLDAGVAKVENTGEGSNKVLKKMLRTKTAWRLAAITIIAIGALVLSQPLGIGLVIGLVIFQILFVVAVARIVFAQGGAL
jgi:hypothetical protein